MSTKISDRSTSYVYAIHENASFTDWCEAEKGIQDTRLSSSCPSNKSDLINNQGETINEHYHISSNL